MRFEFLTILACIVALNIDALAQLEGNISPDSPPKVHGLQLAALSGPQIGWEIILNIAEPRVVDVDFEVYSKNPMGKFIDPICTSEGAGSTERCRVLKDELPPGDIAWIKIFPVAGSGTTFYKISSTRLIREGTEIRPVDVQSHILGIESVEVLQFKDGRYQLRITFTDSLSEDQLKTGKNYSLRDKLNKTEVRLPAPRLWRSRRGRGVRFIGVDISHKDKYVIKFKDVEANIERINFIEREGQKSFENFEGGKLFQPWQKSIKPKIAQGDSTINELGDIGLDLAFSRKLGKKLEFNFDGSFTLNKDDPTNHWNLNLIWRTPLLLPIRQFGIRPLSLSLQENATQALRFHDLSVSATTTFVFWPFKGIQPIFATVGLDEALRINFDGEEFDDPRLNVQVQWGMVGLLGKGSSFFINWQLWRRFDNLGDPRIDPNQKKERQYIQLEFVLPIVDDKNLTVKYADGEFAPTFAEDTSVQLGLEFFFGGKRILLPGKE